MSTTEKPQTGPAEKFIPWRDRILSELLMLRSIGRQGDKFVLRNSRTIDSLLHEVAYSMHGMEDLRRHLNHKEQLCVVWLVAKELMDNIHG